MPRVDSSRERCHQAHHDRVQVHERYLERPSASLVSVDLILDGVGLRCDRLRIHVAPTGDASVRKAGVYAIANEDMIQTFFSYRSHPAFGKGV
jgi:hypothetical protein